MNSSRSIPTRVIGKRLLPLALMSVVVFQSLAIADTRYGPVRPGETLSSIVNENYVLSPFPSQMIMEEIFRNNSGAFISGKIGLLKQGVTLTLPSDSSMASLLPLSRPSTAQVPVRRATVRPAAPAAQPQNNITINRLQERLASVRAERDRLNVKLRQLEGEKRSLVSRITNLESSNSRLNDKIKASDLSLQRVRTSLLKAQETAKSELAAAKTQVQTNVNSAQTDQSALIARRDQRIKALETSIADLQDDHAGELLALKTSSEGKGAEQLTLKNKVEALTDNAEKIADQIAQLKVKNESLVVELAESKAAYYQLRDTKSDSKVVTGSTVIDKVVPENTGANSQASDEPFDISNLNAQNISSQLEKPVTFPLWGMLLGALALALTTLLMFLARGRAKKAAVVAPVFFEDEPVITDDVVFRAADPGRIEPDIEALRVPARRDPSRVAILDPTMSDSVSADEPLNVIDESGFDEHESTEAALKLAMAEAYGDLGDVQAANELLVEVQEEGSQKQSATAQILQNRLAG